MRALTLLLALLVTSPLSATPSSPPCGSGYRKGEACLPTGGLRFVETAAFTKLWAVWSFTVAGTPDSTAVIVRATGAADVRRKYTVATKTDSLDVGYPAAGATKTVNVLAVAFKGGRSSDTVSLGGGTIQGDVAAPTGTLKLIPAAFKVATDSGAVCAIWQKANPGKTPWLVVNTTAVPPCQTSSGPKIFQNCLILIPTVGPPVLCIPSAGAACQIGTTPWTPDVAQYCQARFDAFLLAQS
jgi:hypothetical protein